MSRAILMAIFEKLDRNGDGVVDEQELLDSVATDEALAQLLHLPPPSSPGSMGASAQGWGKGGLNDSQGSLGGLSVAAGGADPVAEVQAIVTDIVKTNKASYDKGMKAAMIELVSPR